MKSYLNGRTDLSWVGRHIRGIRISARVQIAYVWCDFEQFMIAKENDGQVFFCDAHEFGRPIGET